MANKKPGLENLKAFTKYSNKYRIAGTKKFKLKSFNTSPDIDKDAEAQRKKTLQQGVDLLAQLQDILYAQDKWSLLLIFQAMDAAGKDGAIKHVMSGVNPQGCQVTSFKTPSTEELDHDFLWRCQRHLPERGRIGIFNRSYYEEVLVVKVHEEILEAQKIPEELVDKDIWANRYEDIRNYEKYLNRNGIVVIKFFLNVSKNEQKSRFLARIDNPDKNWKFSPGDAQERKHWKEYQQAYEEMITETATEKSPWYVVPADDKLYARVVISSAILDALDNMKLEYPKVSPEKIAELNRIKAELLAEK